MNCLFPVVVSQTDSKLFGMESWSSHLNPSLVIKSVKIIEHFKLSDVNNTQTMLLLENKR